MKDVEVISGLTHTMIQFLHCIHFHIVLFSLISMLMEILSSLLLTLAAVSTILNSRCSKVCKCYFALSVLYSIVIYWHFINKLLVLFVLTVSRKKYTSIQCMIEM